MSKISSILDSKLKIVLAIVCVLVAVSIVFAWIYLRGLGAVDPDNDETVSVNIPSGSGASAIVEILDAEGLVNNRTCSKIHSRIGGFDSLQATPYLFTR